MVDQRAGSFHGGGWRRTKPLVQKPRRDGGALQLCLQRAYCERTPFIQVVLRPMTKLYEALAEAFLAEGVDTQFALMGDGNMHWSTSFARLPGVQTIRVRHEHCAVAAATAYNVATGNIAAASVTCGPGVTQLVTALPAAVRARLPMVVFAGEPPINAKFYNQYIDQVPLVTATGAHYIAAHSVPRMMDYVREAFHVAKYERKPVVLGIPYDLQKLDSTSN